MDIQQGTLSWTTMKLTCTTFSKNMVDAAHGIDENYNPGANLKNAGIIVPGGPRTDRNGDPYLPSRTIGAVQDQYTEISGGAIPVNL